MRISTPLQFFSLVLLMAMLIVTINCVHENAHAMQRDVATADCSAERLSSFHQSPCDHPEQHDDSDGCDTCANCACHAPLTINPLQLTYTPIISDLVSSDPYNHLPEVYLSKFVPPQLTA